MSEFLPELPAGWVWASAEEFVKRITDGEHLTPERSETGVLLLSARNVQNGWLSLDKVDYIPEHVYEVLTRRLLIECGDVLLSCSGTVGRSCVVPENLKFALVRSVAVLKPLAGMGNFISYALRSPQLQQQIHKKKTQTAQANIFQGSIKKLIFPLPPLNEQRRIVAKIEALKARSQRVKEELKAIPALLDQFRQSVLAAAFRGDLTADWRRQDNEEFLGYDFPSTWDKRQLGDVVEGLKQGWSPKCENFPSPSDDIWGVIKTTAVQSLRFVEGENKQLPSHLEPRPELELFEGDLLITRAGPRARAGVTCLVSSVRPKLMACDKVYRFCVKESYILPLYLAYFLNSSLIISLIDELKTGISDSGVNLTQEKFLALPLWFPSIAEQQEIVRRIETFFKTADQVKQQYQETQAFLDQLDRSILAKAFRGELVPQDPNDEPASILLERIRAEREKLDTKKKAKGKREKKSRKAKPEAAEPEQLSLPGLE